MSTPTSASPHHDPSQSEPLLVLASQSPSRVSILESSGIGFTQLVSGVDEDAALARAEAEAGRSLTPGETALALARAKAAAVANLPEAAGNVVLGCDSVFEMDGTAYGKPLTPEVARERIAGMSGRTGTLHTGHWLVDLRETDAAHSATEAPAGFGLARQAEVSFARMTSDEIDAYVATEEPLWVAGSFTIEGYGAAFITGISGESHTVLGLSVNALRELLGKIGLDIPQLWVPRT